MTTPLEGTKSSSKSPFENPFLPKPSTQKSPLKRLLDEAIEEETLPRKRSLRKKPQTTNNLHETTADPLSSWAVNSATSYTIDNMKTTSSPSLPCPEPHDYSKTEPSFTDGHMVLAETADIGSDTVEAKADLQTGALANLLTAGYVPTPPENDMHGSVRNGTAQPTSLEMKTEQSASAQHKRLMQIKAGTKKGKKSRPRRSAYGLRSGRKEVHHED